MSVEHVQFSNYPLGNYGPSKQTRKEAETKEDNFFVPANEEKKTILNPEAVLDAMNIAGLQNSVKVNTVKSTKVEPSDYLSEERMEDIEAMMEKFENGVNTVSGIIGEEFPNISEANKNALAARIFAQE